MKKKVTNFNEDSAPNVNNNSLTNAAKNNLFEVVSWLKIKIKQENCDFKNMQKISRFQEDKSASFYKKTEQRKRAAHSYRMTYNNKKLNTKNIRNSNMANNKTTTQQDNSTVQQNK